MACKVCVMTTAHSAFDVRIYHKECRTLADAGFDVVLVVPHHHDEVVDGIAIRAIPSPRGRLARMVGTSLRVLRKGLRENAAVYHFHDPELLIPGLLLKLLGKKVVYDVHENYRQTMYSKSYLPRHLRALASLAVGTVETLGAMVFDATIAATPAIGRLFSPRNCVVVQNFPMADEIEEAMSTGPSCPPYTVAYVGAITPARGAREMVEAVNLLPEALATRLVLVGQFRPRGLEQEVLSLSRTDTVEILGWRSRAEVGELLRKSSLGLVVFQPSGNHMESQPNKLFEYMAAGLPVVASNFPLWREIVEQCGCGMVVDPTDPADIASAVSWILGHPPEARAMGLRGLEAVRTRYNWQAEAPKLLSTYARLTGIRCRSGNVMVAE